MIPKKRDRLFFDEQAAARRHAAVHGDQRVEEHRHHRAHQIVSDGHRQAEHKNRINKNLKEVISDVALDGATLVELASRFGVNRRTVAAYLVRREVVRH